MPWFQKLCRSTGLMLHHMVRPVEHRRVETNRTVEEQQVGDKVVLRRTTIEEVEIKPGMSEDLR